MKVGLVIILYHPDISHLQKLLTALTAGSIPIVLVDNSPKALCQSLRDGVNYLHYPENIGIAAAQNAGVSLLLEEDCTHVALFDQDSDITLPLVQGLIDGFVSAEQLVGRIAAVGPQIVCDFDQKPVNPKIQRTKDFHAAYSSVQQIIASGMLLSADSFRRVGGKEEGLFIDGVDHEWCWRARSVGYEIVKLRNVTMRHRQGDGRHRILGVTFKRGAPIRLYYQARNILLLSRRSYVPVYWKLRNIPALPLRWVVNRWVFDDGLHRGRFFLKGLFDGIKGRTGPIA